MTVMLYRPAETPNPQVWDRFVEHKVFAEADVAIALSEGWFAHPDEVGQAEPDAASEPPKRRGRPPKEG